MADVVIAGAGPAGAIAALVLARAGVRVTLFDRATFPRDKLCGDTVNPGALAILKRLGLAPVTAGGLPIDGMVVTVAGARVVGEYRDGHRGIAIRRHELDARLVEAAVAAGARLEDGSLVRGPLMNADGTRVEGLEVARRGGVERHLAKVTIAADGRGSRVAHALHLVRTPARPRRWAIGGVFSGVADLTAFGEMHIRDDRYIGVAPLPGGLANACVVTADRRMLRAQDLLRATLHADPQLVGRFARAEMVAPESVLGPLALDAQAAGMPGLLLAGDAAGFIDPMTGDGLRFAFRGAELAAEHALAVVAGEWQDAHERLDAARRREFGAKWRFNRSLRTLAASRGAVRAAAVGAALSPGVFRYAVEYAGDLARV